jgi:hypothetical protein
VPESVPNVFLDLLPGWNLVAAGPGTVFDAPLYEWTAMGYQQVLEAEPWKGYWIHVPTPQSVSLQTVSGPQTLGVTAGWNLVGNPMGSAADLTLPPGSQAFAWGGDGYEVATTLAPGRGAWVFAAAAAMLTMTPVP